MAGVLALVALDRLAAPALRGAGWAAVGAALALLPWLHTRFALVAGVLGLALSRGFSAGRWAGGGARACSPCRRWRQRRG